MKLLKKQRAVKENFYGKLKRKMALFMAVILAVTVPVPGMPLVSHAANHRTGASPAAEDTLKDKGGGFTTAWSVGVNGGFDIEGIEEITLMHPYDSEASYTGDRDQAVETTHLHSGFQTYVQAYDPASPQTVHGEEKVLLPSNGAVYHSDANKISVQMKVHPTWDNKFIQVDYLIQNTGADSKTIQLGTSADLQLGKRGPDAAADPTDPSDSSPLTVDSRGIHMINTGTRSSFECMFGYRGLSLTRPDNIWIGDKADMDANHFGNQTSPVSGGDAAMNYSWNINLAPGETVTKSVAFGGKGASYYLNQAEGDDSNDGTYAHPYQKWKRVMKAIQDAGAGSKFVYVYIQGDYGTGAPDKFMWLEYVEPTPVLNVDLSSTDYDIHGEPSDGMSVRLGDLTIDGCGKRPTSPAIHSAELEVRALGDWAKSRLILTSGITLKNNVTVKSSATMSAINIEGDVDLVLSNCTIVDNTYRVKNPTEEDLSKPGGGIYFNGENFFMEGKCIIKDNTNALNQPTDVYLEDGKYITAMDSLKDSNVGIMTKKEPEMSPGGIVTKASQEVLVAKPVPGSEADQPRSPFAGNFFSDRSKFYTAVGTADLTAAGDHNEKNTVLRGDSYDIKFTIVSKDGGAPIPDAPVIEPQVAAAGDAVTTNAAPAIAGYTLDETKIEQGAPPTLHAAAPGEANPGQITGNMPKQSVTVTYIYRPLKTSISFDVNGGITSDGKTELPDMIGAVGAPMPPEPKVARQGYTFKGWSTENSGPDSPIFSWPASYPDLPGGLKLYAVFAPDDKQTYNYTKRDTDDSGHIVFHTETKASSDPGAYHAESSLSAAPVRVQGYTWKDIKTDPPSYAFVPKDGEVPIGTSDTSGNFTGRMPAQDLTVQYRYSPDPAKKFKLTVKYISDRGTALRTPDESELNIGAAAGASPRSFDSYSCYKAYFETGDKTEELAGGWAGGVQSQPDPDTFIWKDQMPNQDVTLVYQYKTDTSQQFKLIEQYADKDAVPGLENIIPEQSAPYAVGAPVGGTYADLYGYGKAGTGRLADTDITLNKPWDGINTITIAEDGGSFSGTMLPREVTVHYNYKRIPGDPAHPDPAHPWGTVIYLPGRNGSLNRENGVSTAVMPYTGTVAGETVAGFKTGILLDSAAAGYLNQPYSFGFLNANKLTANPQADSYYKPEGWFVDLNGDGVRNTDASNPDTYEPLIKPDQTFDVNGTQAQRTLTASFVEIPEQWYTISFAGEHAVLSGGTNPLKLPYDKKWKDVKPNLPVPTPEVNYLEDGWYDTTDPSNPIKLTDDEMPIRRQADKNQLTYTFVCYQDPKIFGTKVETPDASGALDGSGRGRVTVYDTKEGQYQYILTDLSGTIQMVVPKRTVSQRVEFDGLRPGARYRVYEAVMNLKVMPGEPVPEQNHDKSNISDYAEVLTPVLADNYNIYYNDETEDEAKTRLVISPADPDSDYAVLDKNGQTVPIPGAQEGGWVTSSGSKPSIQVPGLTYDGEYTVVARPRGQSDVTAESRREDGTVITAAPVGDLVLNNYMITTTLGQIDQVGGTDVQDISFKEAHKGDIVTLSAPETMDGYRFLTWKVTVGSLGGQTIPPSQADITFTMPASNLVMSPVYDRTAYPNASVTDEVRGGNKQEIALDPNEIPGMEQTLTDHTADSSLITENKADVTYKLIYKKNGVKDTEVPVLRDSSEFPAAHKDTAFHAAWGLDVSVERYVNGRKVKPATASDAARALSTAAEGTAAGGTAAGGAASEGTVSEGTAHSLQPASASDALRDTVQFSSPPSYRTYIQLDKGDTDMMDYQLYEMIKDGTGALHAERVPILPADSEDNPDDADIAEQDGGLFTFEAKPNSRYVLVYSRAYRLYFKNELPILAAPNYYDVKVRQNESSKMSYYDDTYGEIPAQPSGVLNPKTGAVYNFQDWSYSRDSLKRFDQSRLIKNVTRVYACYTDNEKAVAEERRKLEQAIEDAWTLSNDPFMKRQDSQDLRADIEDARSVLQQEDPRSREEELRAAREKLERQMKHYQDLSGSVHKAYEDVQNHNGGMGGSGHGIKSNPYNATPEKNYTVGTNGNWKAAKEVPGQAKQWAFVLNGGYKLKSMWAYLKYPEVTNTAAGWYHFNSDAVMDTGWFKDEAGRWYYSYKLNEGPEGKMVTGWHLEPEDGNWYYLDPVNGDLATGWKQIDGKWYYFETVGDNAYVHDAAGRWIYGGGGKGGHPLGSMYKNEKTPDGYTAGADGARS